jgi:DUF3047 family protein
VAAERRGSQRAAGVGMIVRCAVAVAVAIPLALAASRAAPQTPGDGECVVLEDFSRGRPGEFPPDWKPRKEAGREVYRLADENGRRFLRALSRGLGIQAGREVSWDLATHPVLAWAWRPRQFPTGADERESKKNDSAVSVYAAFPHTSWSVKALKYVWSERVPRGTRLTSNGGLTQGLVLRTGAPASSEWVEERVNVRDDYRARFGEDAPKPSGIAVLTDADDTKSTAEGDYANFRACRR